MFAFFDIWSERFYAEIVTRHAVAAIRYPPVRRLTPSK